MKIKILLCSILCIFSQNNIYAAAHDVPPLSSAESSYANSEEIIEMDSVYPLESHSIDSLQRRPTLRDIVLQLIETNRANRQAEELSTRIPASSMDASDPQEVRSAHEDQISQRLIELMMSGTTGDDGMTTVERQLYDLLTRHPEFEPLIQRCNAIQAGIANPDNYDIEKYARPSSIVNITDIVLGATLDVGQILGTYMASKWIGSTVIALSMIDGGLTGLRTWLEAKTQSIINYYSQDIQGQQEFIISPQSKEILNEFTETVKSSYAALVKYIDEQGLTEIKQNPIFTRLSHSMSKIQSLNAYGSKVKYFTKILSVLSSTTAGIVSLICGPNTLPTSIAVSASIGFAAIHHRITESNYHAIAARQALELAYIYWQQWGLMDLIVETQQSLEGPHPKYSV